MEERGEIIIYQPDSEVKLEVRLEDETVWLTQAQMAMLFQTTRNNITLHISNIFKEKELDRLSVCKYSLLTASDGKRYRTIHYNLDVIISVGYRVKSKNGILFRKWANNILGEYLLKGYVVNDRHFQDIEYITRILAQYKDASGKLPTSDAMLEFLKAYQRGFKILDDYDHHCLEVPRGQKDVYVIQYDECIKLIHNTMFVD